MIVGHEYDHANISFSTPGASQLATTGHVSVDGARLYYEVAGDGPAAVLAHGATFDTRMWDDQFAALSERFRTVRYDARGFGKSGTQSETPYSVADDLSALLGELDLSSASVIGLSMGGGTALEFALRYPDRLHSLVLVDSDLPGQPASKDAARLAVEIRNTARTDGVEAAKDKWLSHPYFTAASEKPDVFERLRMMVEAYSGAIWPGPSRRVDIDPPPARRLHEIKAPTLVVYGERDMPDFVRFAQLLAEGIDEAELVPIPGAGHMCNMEAPDTFNSTVLEFLMRTE